MSPPGTQKSGTKAAHEKETLSFLWAYHLVYDKSLLLKKFKRNKCLKQLLQVLGYVQNSLCA